MPVRATRHNHQIEIILPKTPQFSHIKILDIGEELFDEPYDAIHKRGTKQLFHETIFKPESPQIAI